MLVNNPWKVQFLLIDKSEWVDYNGGMTYYTLEEAVEFYHFVIRSRVGQKTEHISRRLYNVETGEIIPGAALMP